MRFRTLALALALAAPLAAGAEQTPSLTQDLPRDPNVIVGALPNGLRYYIRKNARPEKRAELRLVVNAGSILEDDDQRGLAHFVEHTAFNGTTNFDKNDLITYLQSIGVRFGADLNASTGFDETIYILSIPTDTARIVDRAFDILEDWAHGQTFDSLEVVNERGIVLEEWRGGKGSGERMFQAILPIAFRGSRYAERLPIGTDASIRSAQPSVLRRFYRDWYRPDLQAVVAVGDFDPARIEALIKQHFTGLTMPASPRTRIIPSVPDNAAPLVAIATDPEAQGSDIELIFKIPHHEERTVGDYRGTLIRDLALTMINRRFDEIARDPDAPFLGAGGSLGGFFARSTDAFFLGAGVKDGGIVRGAEALLTEARRVDQFGFLPAELQRAKEDMVRDYEGMYAEREKTESRAIVGDYVRNYLEGEAIPGIEYEYALVQQLLPGISLIDVNAVAQGWITDHNRVVIAQAPDKQGVAVPTEGELLAVFDRARSIPVAPWTETLVADALVDPLPAPGAVVSESTRADVGVTEWKLSNGIRVFVKPTDFKADEVLLSGSADGGTSLASDADHMSAALATPIMQYSGLGTLSLTDLQKTLSGKVAGANVSFSDTGTNVGGSASPKDLETLFQLVHLSFTAPRLDTAAFLALQGQFEPYLANRGADPDEVYGDTIAVTMAQHHFRARPITAATFAEVDPAKAFQFYRDRMSNAGGFTFAIVGAVELAELKPLVERYLGSLPAGAPAVWRDNGPAAPREIVERTVAKGTEPKANTRFIFTGPAAYTAENRLAMRALSELMQMRLDAVLREQLGGTYSPSISGGLSRVPREEFQLAIEYGSSPENVDRLAGTVIQMVDSLQRLGPTAAEVANVREQITREREVETKRNSFWTGNLVNRVRSGEDIGGLAGPYDAMVRALTAAQIQDAAKLYLNTANYAKFVLLPER